jgi:ferredoxin-thioredoxin reductase catalytic subunit
MENQDRQLKIKQLAEEFSEYAKNNGIRLNPDKKSVERIIDGLLKNEEKYGAKYCPCRRVSGNKEEDSKKICPCIWHKDEVVKDGHCLCRLYYKID